MAEETVDEFICFGLFQIQNSAPNSVTPMKMAASDPHIRDYFMDSTRECSLKVINDRDYR